MSAAELKSLLHKLVVETDDIGILNKMKDVFLEYTAGESSDWAESISDKEKDLLEAGLEDIKLGKLNSHEEVRGRVNQWLKKKR